MHVRRPSQSGSGSRPRSAGIYSRPRILTGSNRAKKLLRVIDHAGNDQGRWLDPANEAYALAGIERHFADIAGATLDRRHNAEARNRRALFGKGDGFAGFGPRILKTPHRLVSQHATWSVGPAYVVQRTEH